MCPSAYACFSLRNPSMCTQRHCMCAHAVATSSYHQHGKQNTVLLHTLRQTPHHSHTIDANLLLLRE